MKNLDVVAGQIKGKREYQEDSFKVVFHDEDGPHLVCLLADGMGGHAAGDVAADTAISEFEEHLLLEESPCHSQFIGCLDKANRKLAEKVSVDSKLNGMGCTFVGMEIVRGACHWISVGDSPLFLLREGQLKRINDDHSMAKQLDSAARAGEITRDEAMNSPSRNVLLSALTGDRIVRLDYSTEPVHLREGDWLILASDGVETLSPEQLIEIVSVAPMQTSKDVFDSIMKAITHLDNPGQDNATAIIVHVNKLLSDVSGDADEIITRPIFRF